MEFLGLASVTIAYVVVALLAIAIPLAILLLSRHVLAGFVLVSIVFLVETIFLEMGAIQLGVSLYLQDLATGLIALAALLRFALVADARPRLTIWYVFLAAVGLSLVIGLGRFGSGAGVAARPYFYAVAVTSYVVTFPASAAMVRQLFAALVWLAAGVSLVTAARWIIVLTPLPDFLPAGGRFGSPESSVLRVIKSDETVLLAQLLVVGTFVPAASVALKRMRAVLPLLFIAVLMLQHRSVWLACMAGVGARFLLRGTGGSAIKQLAAIAVVTAAVIVPLTMTSMFGEASTDIAQSADRALAGADTAGARLSSWRQLVDRWYHAGPQSIAIGQPFGTNMERYANDVSSQKINFQAHNFYVQTLVNTGLVGLLAIALAYGWTAVRLYRLASHPVDGPIAGALFLMLVMQAIYYVPYGVDYLQGMVLGTAMAFALRGRRHAPQIEPEGDATVVWRGIASPNAQPDGRGLR